MKADESDFLSDADWLDLSAVLVIECFTLPESSLRKSHEKPYQLLTPDFFVGQKVGAEMENESATGK